MSVIDDYLKNVQPVPRAGLERIRNIIAETAPDATEAISYGMPAFKYQGKYLCGFAPFKDHSSIFPGAAAVEAFKNELGGRATSKGTIQFTDDQPLPEELIVKIIKHRMADITG